MNDFDLDEEEYEEIELSKQKNRKYERNLKYKNRLIKKAKLYHGAYYKDKKYLQGKRMYIFIDKPYYKRFYYSNKRQNSTKIYKRNNNKKIRKYKCKFNRSNYKKFCYYKI